MKKNIFIRVCMFTTIFMSMHTYSAFSVAKDLYGWVDACASVAVGVFYKTKKLLEPTPPTREQVIQVQLQAIFPQALVPMIMDYQGPIWRCRQTVDLIPLQGISLRLPGRMYSHNGVYKVSQRAGDKSLLLETVKPPIIRHELVASSPTCCRSVSFSPNCKEVSALVSGYLKTWTVNNGERIRSAVLPIECKGATILEVLSNKQEYALAHNQSMVVGHVKKGHANSYSFELLDRPEDHEDPIVGMKRQDDNFFRTMDHGVLKTWERVI